MTSINKKFSRLADEKTINKVIQRLKVKGVYVDVAENGEEAKEKFFKIIPSGSEIMKMTSVTLEETGIDKEIESERYKSVRKILESSNQEMERKRLGTAHAWSVGSVHALTEDGSLLIASATGSQLPSYAYGADNILWIIGAQKIVKDIKEGLERIYKYSFPLENERSLKVYGMSSGVNKILIINNEFAPNRLNVIIVKEKLGF